jgi:hypothetical protein
MVYESAFHSFPVGGKPLACRDAGWSACLLLLQVHAEHRLDYLPAKIRPLRLWEEQPETAWSTEPELFDTQADPADRTNVIGAHPAIAQELNAKLNQWWPAILVDIR